MIEIHNLRYEVVHCIYIQHVKIKVTNIMKLKEKVFTE